VQIGSLDGIPVVDRDRANRKVLRQQLAAQRQDLAAHEPPIQRARRAAQPAR
jgi:hypothetical protein